MASKDLRVEAEPTKKNEEKSLMGGENCGHMTPSSIRVWGYQEKKINPAISSPVRSEALRSNLSSSDFCSKVTTPAFETGRGTRSESIQREETNYGQMGIAA